MGKDYLDKWEERAKKNTESIKQKQYEDWFLSLPKKMKLKILNNLIKEDEYLMAVQTARILLDAPLDDGGILTEEIEKLFNDDLKRTYKK